MTANKFRRGSADALESCFEEQDEKSKASKLPGTEALISSLVKKIVGNKDQDIMKDTGGSTKGPIRRTPWEKPPREDLRKRYRTKDKLKEDRDPDVDVDPDGRED